MSIIGINGRINSGKDTIGKIIQYLSYCDTFGRMSYSSWEILDKTYNKSEWQIKKFADKLKDIVCLLINCTREQLEDREFKNKELGEEWRIYYNTYYKLKTNTKEGRIGKIHSSEEDAKREIKENGVFFNLGNTVLETKVLTPRLLLQLLGTECGRNIIHPNIWVNALMSKYYEKYEIAKRFEDGTLSVYPEDSNWIITDLRFPNELEAIKDRGGITIRVNRTIEDIAIQLVRKDFGNQVKREVLNADLIKDMQEFVNSNLHESETALDDSTFDYEINNFGTIEDLIKQVKEILIKEKLIN